MLHITLYIHMIAPLIYYQVKWILFCCFANTFPGNSRAFYRDYCPDYYIQPILTGTSSSPFSHTYLQAAFAKTYLLFDKALF